MKKFLKGFLISLIPVCMFTAGILILSSSDKPYARHIPEVIHPGYQTEPAKYVVEASYAKYWHDSRIPLLIILAYVIVIGGTVAIITAAETDDKVNKAGVLMLVVIWLVSGCLIFVPMAFKYGTSSYQGTLTENQYELYKGDLDSLFPYVESESK